MVARLAHFWRKLPHEIWALPFTYYIALRDDYLDIVAPTKKKRGTDEDLADINAESSTRAPDGETVVIDYDAVMRQQRRKAVRRGR